MKKLFKMGIVLTFMLFVLTGCTNTEYNVKVNNDGSGKVEYSVEFDEGILASEYEVGLGWLDDFKFLTNIKKIAEENGYSVEDIKKTIEDAENNGNTYEVVSGCKVSREFENISEEFKIEESIGEEYAQIIDDTGLKIEKGVFVTKYTQSFTVDLTKAGEVVNKVDVTYEFPKGIAKSNADSESFFTNKLTWNLEKGETQQIEYTVYSFNISLIIAIIVVILVLVLIIVLIIKKKKSKKIQK